MFVALTDNDRFSRITIVVDVTLLGKYGIVEIQRTGKIALSELAKVEA